MRPFAVAAVAAAAGVVGGLVGVAAGDGLGLGDSATVTVLDAGGSPPATAPVAPLPAGRFDPAAIYARRAPGVVTVYAEHGATGTSQGSGFVVDRDGTILTNSHVVTDVAEQPATVSGARRVFVEFGDGERVPAKLVGWDLFNDTGVLTVDPAAHRVEPVPLGNSDAVRVGEPIAAIGSPFGKQSSLAVGVVSAVRSIASLTSGFSVADAIQVDAPINRGNSGGPLFDARGRVIGINAQIQSTSGTAEGVGFAIPINSARRSLEQLRQRGRVSYAYVGVTTQDVTPGLAAALGLPEERGALVVRVSPGTPAASAGLRAGTTRREVNGIDVVSGGDVIVAVGKEPIRNTDDFGRVVGARLRPGQTVPFTVLRDGRRATVEVTLAERPLRVE